jgi:hypothetical protein
MRRQIVAATVITSATGNRFGPRFGLFREPTQCRFLKEVM